MEKSKLRGKSLLFPSMWVYGDLVQSKPNSVDGKRSAWIIPKSPMPFEAISTPTSNFIEVDPETVGQCIFSAQDGDYYKGDIIQIEHEDTYNYDDEDFTEDSFISEIKEKGVVEGDFGDYAITMIDWLSDMGYIFKIISNIHDKETQEENNVG